MIRMRTLFRLYILLTLLCASVSAMAQSKTYYVSPTAKGMGDGTSWQSTMTLADALNTAKAGEQIWVQGFEQITGPNQLYVAPAEGFSVKSGVQLYGGFKGTEKSINDRETLGKPYQMKYRSVLSGDINRNDNSDNTNIIFPANTTRQDNATHVLSVDMTPTSTSGNNNTYPTVINGFTITGGHADGTSEKGGGIYISGDNTGGGNFRIERCFLFNNYATQGGAVYVSSEVQNRNNGESLINQCVVYNNAAGERAAVENQGGGIYLAGAATVVNTSIFNNENGGLRISSNSKVVNSTIARNTGAGVDMTATPSGTNVYNSIIWGNTFLSVENQPGFKNSAYHEVTVTNAGAGTDADGNVYVAKENRESASGPMFDAPSIKTSYDRDFNWRQTAYPLWSWNVLEGSVMIDKGNGDFYVSGTYGNEDMAGKPRISGTSISIGAYEYQYLPKSRICYVKPTATGTGDGSSWENASADLQKMIDELANNANGQAGEVWVAAGTYTPQSQLISGTAYSASFRMRDGISVYGGFNKDNPETSKFDRQKGTMPWDFTNETILQAAYYDHNDFSWTNNKWTLTSDSRHVVWFAPMPGESAFTNVTTLDGVTIRGGYAQGGTGLDDFKTDRGGGVYMDGANAYLSNCIVKENYATGNGGGVYLKDGRVMTSFIYNNNADADGGAVYVDDAGLVLRSMLSNNSAHNGAGAYLHNGTGNNGTGNDETGNDHPEYLILSTCVVSNNTMTGNGAVYCDKGGVMMQNTITNNNCVTATDATDPNASQTGGIYIDEYALVVNSVLWNNQMGVSPNGTNIPMYARNPSADKVKFLNNAISGVNNAVWNNTLQQQTLSLVDENAGKQDDGNSIGPRFTEPKDLNITTFDLEDDYGVQDEWADGIISYYWKPVDGSNLWARGMALGQLPDDVVLAPELDIEGNIYAQKPAAGAFMVKAPTITPSFENDEDGNNKLVLYIDAECTEPSHDGSSWAKAFRSLNNALAYCAALSSGDVEGVNGTYDLSEINFFEIRVLEGDLWPRYAFTNNDPLTATITVPKTASGKTIYIYGGYHRTTDNNTAVRDPLTYRSIINGNTEGKDITQGLYHCITVEQGAEVVFDGFHVINGYAAGEASRQYGAGLLAHAGSTVTVRNCIFENNTAQDGAAIDAREATLTMQNCVVNNNTNTTETASVVNAQTLTMEHVTVVNNIGAAPADMGTSSFSAGNTSGNSVSLSSVGEAGAANFTNPTNAAGATLGFDTYLGGYSSFRPLTSSNDAGTEIINQAPTSTLTSDITTINDRDLGGVPDLGAYEADLPKSGRVYYVRTNGNDNNSGLSWNKAFATVRKAVETANTKAAVNGKKPQVWVSAGTYTQAPKSSSVNCFEILDGVDVYGAFPKTGNPGINDRHPFISTSVYNNYENIYKPEDYETILTPSSKSGNRRVLGQADTYNPVNNNHSSFKNETIWDGFTLTNGYLDSDDLDGIVPNGYARDGGAGARIFSNVVLRNCIVVNNLNEGTTTGNNNWCTQTRGGGVYCDEGTLVNCYILKNILGKDNQYTAYGGGCYMYNGTAYNCVISENETNGYHGDGAGIFIENAAFYNNTIVKNTSNATDRGNGGICIWTSGPSSQLTIYNCIVLGNSGKKGDMIGSGDIAVSSNGGYINCNYSITSNTTNASRNNGAVTYNNSVVRGTSIFADYDRGNYRLGTMDGANMGIDEPIVNGTTIRLSEYTDMDFTDRIKDCRVDAGAYERSNIDNTGAEVVGNTRIFYVTQNGSGTTSGNSLTNSACATKLQIILNAAGELKKNNPDLTVVVKVAGYSENGTGFVYHANTLSNENDPQSYSYVVPYGVILEGGYNENVKNWSDEGSRDIIKNPTKLSAIYEGTETQLSVNGYHTVTFGEKPADWTGEEQQTIIDGVWLTDGSANSMAGAGNPNTRGGGAIVPSGAHVRNCVVMDCEAIEGGGLYLMPGATVSGTLVMNNSAEDGGGVYADNTDVSADSRAHILSCTIANNEASSTGGGLYMEDGAVMNVNTVVFGNKAGSDKNVSGVVNQQFKDSKLDDVFNITEQNSFYPFNSSFVETQEMPSDFENRMLESDKSLYFADDYYRLKDYSLLIKHGVKTDYQDSLVATFNVAESDMQNIARVQTGNGAYRLDAGAFAYEGGILPEELFTRIFVSQTTNVTLTEGSMKDYLGRSFYTSFSTLEDALGYIRSMREKGLANDNTEFEILVAGGTYKPSNERTTNADVTHDQRLYSFEVPQGVSIYGGFVGTENYGSLGDENTQSEISTTSGSIQVDNMGDISTILGKRNYSDFNQNGINEPWELANQTILSGQINASSTAQNAYHVVFTSTTAATTVDPVVLDGLTVMYGQTDDALSYATNEDEQGRGGGIYSNGVTYIISRCRLLNNTAVRGGAVFVRNADLNLSGCILAGNKTVKNTAEGTTRLNSRGGAAYVSGIDKDVYLRAVNTLWANNESAEEGGAIGTNFADGLTTYHDPLLYIMNNTFVRNKAVTNPVIYAHNGKSHIVNTLIWGNVGETYQDLTDLSNIYDVSHCASDVDYVGKFAPTNTDKNILLSTDNMNDEGPRFTNPSTTAGVAGNSASSLWNPVAISVVTDAGDGTEHTTLVYPGETGHYDNTTTGAYKDWFSTNGVDQVYMDEPYSRYSGPYGENGTPMCKPIDIGLYEYQYVSNFSTMPAIYVATLSAGDGSGDSWANATDDLRGAIVGAANPTDKIAEREIFVRDGNYSWSRLSANSAYILNMSTNDNYSKSLTLKGSCTGSGDQQDFSKPTVIRNDGTTKTLMSVSANTKAVTFEGFTFINNTTSGIGMSASAGSGGSLTLKNCGFRISPTGLNISGNSGKVLIYNTLFADGGTGLAADGNTTVVNATFAQNKTDLTGTPAGIYNSVAWRNNETQNLQTDNTNNNVAIASTVANDNVHEGPNFVDPFNKNAESRDYHIRPSVLLLNKGSNDNYIYYALGLTADNAVIPTDEVDLGNNARLVDTSIDIGAYEYEAPLQPIVYVKPDLTGAADGKSWETALGDLQGAVDLAGLYALNHQSETEDVNGYVFVHGNYHDTGSLNLSLGNTKVYGGMNDERSTETVTENIVSDLLGKRKGMLENTNRSSLNNVTISADGSIVDGFVVTDTATVNNGVLSTSIVTEKGSVTGTADGLLYNSLVLGAVADVKAVNVTATKSLDNAAEGGSGNNRASVTETNTYVTDDYWKYQLMETAADDIDKGADATTQPCIGLVGHSRDLIGNLRIRNTVDNGCFETWNICDGMTSGNVITSTDYPVGKSVVYVRKGQELKIENATDGTLVYKDEASAFNPGFLLLEHQAGLRGNGNYISLTNLAVERDVNANGNDLAAMPFKVTSISSYGTDGTNESYELMRYSGRKRAAYSYQYDGTDSEAWIKSSYQDLVNRDETEETEGFLIENTSADDITVRFYGKSEISNVAVYKEGGNDKSIELTKWNYNDSWTTDDPGIGNRFTHKENMSWNLFGSPYLCAMNYSDMEYGRVIYGYSENSYKTINTANETSGYIPAGDAVFTQTATLKDYETVNVSSSAEKSGDSYAATSSLSVSIKRTGVASEDDVAYGDILQLGAVPASEARNEFDMSADGVKWMSGGEAQIYATRSGGRYSLLSAVSIDGKVAVGVTVPEPGMYTIAVPDDCMAEDYETVVLDDAVTGRSVDLLEGGYDFTTVEEGDIIGRFNISFNRKAAAGDDIRAYFTADDIIRVEGVEPGDNISVYSVDGMRVASVTASSNVEDVRASVAVVAIVKAGGKTVKIRK